MDENILWVCPVCESGLTRLGICSTCDFQGLYNASQDRILDARKAEKKENYVGAAWVIAILLGVWIFCDHGLSRTYSYWVPSSSVTTTPEPKTLTDEEFQAYTAMNKFAEDQFAGWKLEGSTLDVRDANDADHIRIFMNFSKDNENKTVDVILEKFNTHLDQPTYWKGFLANP